MNADQRGYFSFSTCVHRRSSAAKPFSSTSKPVFYIHLPFFAGKHPAAGGAKLDLSKDYEDYLYRRRSCGPSRRAARAADSGDFEPRAK
jgi:hypothetical protein